MSRPWWWRIVAATIWLPSSDSAEPGLFACACKCCKDLTAHHITAPNTGFSTCARVMCVCAQAGVARWVRW